MRTIILALAMVFLSSASSPPFARAGEQLVTLEELEAEAVKNNPELLMAGKKAEAARARSSAASGLPDPMVGYMVQNEGRLSDSTIGIEPMSMRGITITQELPFPGKRSTMGRAAGRMAEQAQFEAEGAKLQTLRDLRNAYYDYYLAFRSSEILQENKEIMKSFQRIAETRYATGQGIQQDVLRAQIEVSMLLERIAMEEQKKEALSGMISSLVGRDPLAPLGRPADVLRTKLDRSPEDLARHALEHSPMLKARQRMVDAGREELLFSKQQYLPDMVLSGGVFDRGGLMDVWQASVMFKVPLYFWNTASGVRAASAELQAARHDYDGAKLMLLAKMKDLASMAQTSERLLNLYEAGIIPQSQMARQSASSSYQVGKVDFQALLEAETLVLRYQLAYEQELVNLNKSLAMIREAAGMETGNETND